MKLTRKQAKAIGASRCFGSVCALHPEHEGERLVSGACVECARESVRKRRAANPEKATEQGARSRANFFSKLSLDPSKLEEYKRRKSELDKRYRAENSAKIRAGIAAWNSRNPEKVKEYSKRSKLKNAASTAASNARYVLENLDKVRASKAAWKKSNPHKVAAWQQKRHAAEMQRTPPWLTDDDFWMLEQAYELAALRTKMFGFAWHVDHVIPLQGRRVSGLHTPYNVQVIPAVENMRKLNKFEIA